ncbi:MAG: FAD-dependent oxidoreductase [Candidatus Omnitrophota bacterium]
MYKTEAVVIGAGIIGLSVAARLSEKKKAVYILEKNASFGQETSSRNSEVIHAGIYYPKDSLKARTCLEGNRLTYDKIVIKIAITITIPPRKTRRNHLR